MMFVFPIYVLMVGFVITSDHSDDFNNDKHILTFTEESKEDNLSKTRQRNVIRQVEQLQGLDEDEFRPPPSSILHSSRLSKFFEEKSFDDIRECPIDFFPLSDTGMELDNEAQGEIFKLLEFNRIKEIIQVCILESEEGIEETNLKIADALRDEVVDKHKEALVEILTKASNIDAMKRLLTRNSITSYEKLCNFISKTVIHERLKKAIDDGENICPREFFPLKNILKIKKSIQKDVFKLLKVRELASALFDYNYLQQDEGIERFIGKNPNCLGRLRDRVVENHWKGMVDILVEIPELRMLSEAVKAGHYVGYGLLCDVVIPEAIIYGRLKEETKNGDASMICPDGFFLLRGSGVMVDELIQRDIFKLLSMNKIAYALFKYKYYEQRGSRIKEFIGATPECMDWLRNEVIRLHEVELVGKLIKVQRLETLLEIFRGGKQLSYEKLRKFLIPRTIINGQLKIELDDWKGDISEMCPKGFFSLGGIVEESRQRNLFKLLRPSQAVNILFRCNYLQYCKGIKEFISENPRCVRKLCDSIVANHWKEVVDILVEIPGLETLSIIEDDAAPLNYERLLDVIIPEVIWNGKLRKETVGGKDVSKICPKGFFPLEGTGVEVEISIEWAIFKLLKMKDIIKTLFDYGYHREQHKGIKEFISRNPVCVYHLRSHLLNNCWEELIDILAEIPQLVELAEIAKNHVCTSYTALCDLVSRAIIYEKLKREIKDLENIADLCPDELFSLNGAIQVEESVQRRIFQLLEVGEIVEILFDCEYHKQEKIGFKEFISSNPIHMHRLCNELLNDRHWKKLVDLLSQIPELEVLYMIVKDDEYLTYGYLCKYITSTSHYYYNNLANKANVCSPIQDEDDQDDDISKSLRKLVITPLQEPLSNRPLSDESLSSKSSSNESF